MIIFVGGCASQAPPLVSVTIDPPSAAIATGQTIQFTAIVTNDTTGVTWTATSGTIDANGNYTAPSGAQSTTATVTAASVKSPSRFASATVHVVTTGQVATTANPQVALYSISAGAAGNVSVQFGTDLNYGLTTWAQPVPQGGGPVQLFVAGMRGSTQYHMRGVVQFSDGTQFTDADHLFLTRSTSLGRLFIQAATSPGMTPQSRVELLDMLGNAPTVLPLEVTDLDGQILWGYNPQLTGLQANPIKLRSNGHFLINWSSTATDGANSILQEIDLAGTLIWQMTVADLNAGLAKATCADCNITVLGTHHDFLELPNGHLIVIAALQQVISGTTVTGDAIIDLDPNHNPVWVWNEFDHLDVNRQPMGFPDWTHTNAVIYSADDGNLIISIRHQNWLVKVDYSNGKGSGDILWKLGYQGDFALVGGTDPTDWFYAQHGPSFVSTNTTGKFSLAVFDNGTDRVFPTGVTCGAVGAPACLYSTAQILQIDETAKTATFEFHPTTPDYSFFGGNTALLKNGNVEYCESAGGPGEAGDIYEVTNGSTPETVWHMNAAGQYVYRGQRIPSLYPGVQW